MEFELRDLEVQAYNAMGFMDDCESHDEFERSHQGRCYDVLHKQKRGMHLKMTDMGIHIWVIKEDLQRKEDEHELLARRAVLLQKMNRFQFELDMVHDRCEYHFGPDWEQLSSYAWDNGRLAKVYTAALWRAKASAELRQQKVRAQLEMIQIQLEALSPVAGNVGE